jgi:hypothetical protein
VAPSGEPRLDARHQLHAAYDLLDAIGAEAFAERARRELLATGEKVRKREVDTYSQLTSQEEHIVRLARTDAPTPRLPRSYSSAPAPSNGTPQGVRQTGHHLPQGPPQRVAPAR